MIRNAFVLVGAIIAAACFGCSPPPAPPPAMALARAPLQACASGNDPGVFLSKVAYFADPTFAPRKGGPLPNAGALPSDYLSGLRDAFCAAPPGFQQVLSSLDAVYVNGTSCVPGAGCFGDSWGWLRSIPGGRQRIVALSSWLWTAGTTYSSYESALTQSILPSAPGYQTSYSNALSCTSAGVCTAVDNLPTALLAALSHEVGHIRWFEWVNANSAYCGGKFFANSWRGRVHQPPGSAAQGYWRKLLTLGERNYEWVHGGWLDRHLNPPQTRDVDATAPGAAQNKLIYQWLVPSAPWASLFAAMSPDEDFVETYKFKVLTDLAALHPLTSARITVPQAGAADIVSDYRRGAKGFLSTKVSCITGY
jgi:hypothetical protein